MAQYSVIKIISFTLENLVTRKDGAKNELLLNKQASGAYREERNVPFGESKS
jgi:hypothetical protein